jgi:hypothetical protein
MVSFMQTVVQLNINKIANPNDLKQWYSVKDTKHRINSKSTRGIVVLTCDIKKINKNLS